MNLLSEPYLFRATSQPPDLEIIKQGQQATWASGDFSAIGVTLQIVGERLVEAIDLRAGEEVLDVAAGNGNATLAAARHFGRVTSTDFVQDLLNKGHARAQAEDLAIHFRLADAESLPFVAGSFDAVVSTFGAMFTPDQGRVAREMLRVLRPGGRIGMANWTPEGFIGQLFRLIGDHVPAPKGLKSPLLWGTEQHLAALFSTHAESIRCRRRNFKFRYLSSAHWLQFFRKNYGPLQKAFAALDGRAQQRLAKGIIELLEESNIGGADSLVVPAEYLEVVITKRHGVTLRN